LLCSAQALSEKTAGAEKPRYINKYLGGGEKNFILEPEDHTTLEGRSIMYEVTQYPEAKATKQQQKAADDFAKQSFLAAKKKGWFKKEQGEKDGFKKMFNDIVHYYHRDYVLDDEILNPEKPEFLMYFPSAEGDKLVGVMYLMNHPTAHGPQIGGPLTLWHYHVLYPKTNCFEKGVLMMAYADDKGECAIGVPRTRTPEMIHVWFFEHNQGRYASGMGLTPEDYKLMLEELRGL
jgi:hypothetical protein